MYICGFDIESDWTPECDKTWVAQWALATPDGIVTGTGDESSIYATQCNIIDTLLGYKRDMIVAVHNLNFDMRFLLLALERFTPMIDRDHPDEYGYSFVYRNSKIISAELKNGPYRIKFHDTALLHPGTSVDGLGKLLGSPKLEQPAFYPGWSKEHTDLKYVMQDADIVRQIRQIDYENGMTQGTASSFAWKTLKKSINSTYFGRWKELYPILKDEYDKLSRMCYVGGFNYSGNRGYHPGPVYHVDINSSYPHKYRDYPLPYGEPTTCDTIPDYGYWEGIIWAKLKVKKDCVAWYTPKRTTDIANENIYRAEIGEEELEYGEGIEMVYTPIPLTVNAIDWETLNENYDLSDIRYGEVFLKYKTRSGDLRQYADGLIKEKAELKKKLKKNPNDAVLQLKYSQVKYKLNMPSGRFGLRKESDRVILENGSIIAVPDEDINDSYVPVISAICAYGRQQVIRALNTVPPNLRYHVDTDSVIAGAMPDVEVGPELGEWELEIYEGIYEGGMKKYIEVQDGTLKLTCAGVPKRWKGEVPVGMHVELLDAPELIFQQTKLGDANYKIKSDWLRELYEENGLDPDNVNTLKLLPKRVPGGVILMPSQYDLHKGTGYSVKLGRMR